MKRLLFLLVMLAFLPLMLPAQEDHSVVIVGTGTQDDRYPFNTYYKHSTSQTIYAASEIGVTGYIDTIWFQASTTASYTFTSLHIYMGTTSASAFANSTDWILPEALDEVYAATSNVVVGGAVGWFALPLSTPYYYNGTENLVVAVTKTDDDYSYDYNWYYTTVASSYIYRQIDNTESYGDITTLSRNVSGTIDSKRPNIRLSFNTALEPPTCQRPINLTIDTVTSDSVHFSWMPTEDELSFLAGLILNNDTTWMELYDVTELEISELLPNTNYKLCLFSMCDGERSYNAATVSFRTECAPVQPPYEEGFEEGIISPCWQNSDTYSSWSVVGGETYSGDYAVQSYSYGDSIYLASCIFDFSQIEDGATLNFAYKLPFTYSGDNSHLVVAYRTSEDAAWTAITVYTDATGDEWELAEDLSLPNSAGASYYQIAFVNATQTSGTVMLDQVEVGTASSCSRPVDLVLTSLSYNQAEVSWTGCDLATLYEVRYGITNNVNDPANSSFTTGNTSYTLESLDQSTDYTVWVRSLCGDYTTHWSRPLSFTSQQSCAMPVNARIGNANNVAASVAWQINTDEGEPLSFVLLRFKLSDGSEWEEEQVTGENYYFLSDLTPASAYDIELASVCGEDTSAVVSLNVQTTMCGEYAGGDENGNSYIPFHSNYEYGYTQSIYPSDAIVSDTIMGLYWHTADAPWNYENRTLSIAIGNTSLSSVSTSNHVAHNTLTEVATNISVNFGAPGWIYISFNTPFIHDGHSNIVVAVTNNTGQYSSFTFYTHTPAIGNSVYWYQDGTAVAPANPTAEYSGDIEGVPDIRFDINCDGDLCWAPVVAVTETDIDQIQFAWAPSGDEESWIVGYRKSTETEWNDELAETTTYTFSTLDPSTSYMLRVGVICNDDTAYTVFQAYTDCAAVSTPYSQDFSEDGFDHCWTRSGNEVEFYNGELYMHGNAYAVLPEIDDILSSLQVSFSAEGESNATLAVGIAEGINPLTGVTYLDTLSIGTTVEEYEVNCTDYTGDGRYIVLKSMRGYNYIDDLYVGLIPTCLRPVDLTVSDISTDGATLTWTSPSDASVCWLVEYGTYSSTGDMITTNTEVVPPTANSTCTLSNLDAATTYWYRVRTVCSIDDTSRVSRVATFTTACDIIVAPWTETFSGTVEGLLPSCWDNSLTNAGELNNVAVYQYGGNSMIRLMMQWLDYGDCVILTPEIAIPEGADYDLVFKYSHFASTPEMSVAISTDGGLNFVALGTLSNSTDDEEVYNPTPWSTANYSLSAYAGQTVIVKFQAYSDYGYGAIFIDDVMIDEYTAPEPECVVPTGLSAQATNSTTVQVSWIPEGDEVEWQLLISSDVTGEYTYSLGATSTPLENLTPNTIYTIAVRAICGLGDTSDWSEPVTVTTPENSGIDDLTLSSHITIYPNPAAHNTTVQVSHVNGTVRMIVYDLNGHEVYSDQMECNNGCLHAIELEGLSQGAYFLHVASDHSVAIRKLFVVR